MAEYRIMQDGIQVAHVEGPEPKARNGIGYYAFQYSKDGPLQIEKRIDGVWRPVDYDPPTRSGHDERS